MEEQTRPLRQVLKRKGLIQQDIADKLKRSRQTVSSYIDDYERTGRGSDPNAQELFDRLMADEHLRLLNIKETNDRLRISKARIEILSKRDKDPTGSFQKFLEEILRSHPDAKMYDWEGNVVTPESLDLDRMWVNYDDNEQLISVLTDDEKERWEGFLKEFGETFEGLHENGRIERACILENLWDSTDPRGKPIVYDDVFECVISEEEAGAEPYRFGCETFCMCSGGTARIYADGIRTPKFEHELDIEVYATIETISERGTIFIDSVILKPCGSPFRYVGQTDALIPGYKYVYSLGIRDGKGDFGEVNEQEYTLMEGYHAQNSHPLK